ncbi:hypothetical protein EBU24_01075 [bacterium]|nr:hypothetical protein [bacterium]
MTPLVNIAPWIKKSGRIQKDLPFSDFTPNDSVTINFLIATVETWIRFSSSDGKVYSLFLPTLIPTPISVSPEELATTQILSTGIDWQGLALPAENPASFIYWVGN